MLNLAHVLPHIKTNGHGSNGHASPVHEPVTRAAPVLADYCSRRAVMVYNVDVFFNARHSVEIGGKTGPVHPHSFRVSVQYKQVAQSNALETMHSARMRDLIQHETGIWNGRLLNEMTPFNNVADMTPTIERIAMVLFRRLQQTLPPLIKLESVSVWDSPTNNVTYAEFDE